MVFLGQRASDRFGEAETLKFSQQMTFQLGDSAVAPAATRQVRQGDANAGSSDTPRGLGCRYVNRKAETEAEDGEPATGFHSRVRIRARGHT
jgi:hypothetical protein